MKKLSIIFFVILLFSCKKEPIRIYGKTVTPNEINVFKNDDINNFVSLILTQDKNNLESLANYIDHTKFIGNEFRKNSIILNSKFLILTKSELDSLISQEDWSFIKEQISDEKKYFISKKYFNQKILNADSLRIENMKFSQKQHSKFDSLKKVSFEKAKKYITEKRSLEYSEYIKKSTPILHIDKPLFNKDKTKVIFSFSTYSGPLSAFSEVSLYEFRKNKWVKIKILGGAIS